MLRQTGAQHQHLVCHPHAPSPSPSNAQSADPIFIKLELVIDGHFWLTSGHLQDNLKCKSAQHKSCASHQNKQLLFLSHCDPRQYAKSRAKIQLKPEFSGRYTVARPKTMSAPGRARPQTMSVPRRGRYPETTYFRSTDIKQ